MPTTRRRPWSSLSALALAMPLGALAAQPARSPQPVSTPEPASTRAQQSKAAAQLPIDAPAHMRATYLSALSAPLPAAKSTSLAPRARAAAVSRVAPLATIAAVTTPTSVPIPATIESFTYLRNDEGGLLAFLKAGRVTTANNAFFQSLGSNGRSCFSCHQPATGMTISAAALRQAFTDTAGQDPVFAPVDGATCPSNVPVLATSGAPVGGATGSGQQTLQQAYSLLLNKGLFRVFLPVPKQTSDLSAVGGLPAHPTEFTISVVSDPYGCNTQPAFAQVVDPVTQEVTQMISVYRRPRMAANLKFMTTPAFAQGVAVPTDAVTGAPVIDPVTRQAISGNLMWDGREPTLESQARDATLGHAQALVPPTAAQIAQIVAFENQVFTSQIYSKRAGALSGATVPVFGNPDFMAKQPVTFGKFALYDAWLGPVDTTATKTVQEQRSIARGQALFNSKTFSIGDVAGFNNARGVNNPTVNTCASCHGNMQAGSDPFAAGQRAIGTGGQATAFNGPAPSSDLPIFKLTCTAPFKTAFDGTEVVTNDPGLALITGRCADIGRKSVPQIRSMAARAPYFSDGSAPTVRAVVDFYNKRFSIGLSAQEATDLTNFLLAM